MTPRITLITLGVDDPERAVAFYAVLQQAERAGATIVKPAQATFYGGHAGYFQDPDGHLWEVAFNPGFASPG